MKTKTIISALLVILVLIILVLARCEKDSIVIDPVSQYSISASNGPNGTITPKGVVKVDEANSKIFTIKPDPGYIVDSFMVDGVLTPLSDSTYSILDVNKNYEVSVTFKKDPTFPWDLVDERGWVEDTLLVLIDGVWYTYDITPWNYYYYPNGENKVTNGQTSGFYHWDIDYSKTPAELHTGRSKDFPEGEVSKILRLDKTTLILAKDDIKVIYKHP